MDAIKKSNIIIIFAPEMEEDFAVVFGRFDEAKVVLERGDEALLSVAGRLSTPRHDHAYRRLGVVLATLADLELHLVTGE